MGRILLDKERGRGRRGVPQGQEGINGCEMGVRMNGDHQKRAEVKWESHASSHRKAAPSQLEEESVPGHFSLTIISSKSG